MDEGLPGVMEYRLENGMELVYWADGGRGCRLKRVVRNGHANGEIGVRIEVVWITSSVPGGFVADFRMKVVNESLLYFIFP